jgi:hypothetical protein
MSAVAAVLAALLAFAECGISTSPFGATSDPADLEECNGGWY